MSLRIVYFGTPAFSAEILRHILSSPHEVVAVVSQPDRPKGRSLRLQSTPVKSVAEERGIPVYQPEKASDSTFVETLRALDADLFVVVAYGEIVRDAVLACPKIDCINLHTSLLPKYRGAAPVQAALKHGEEKTGVTVMRMVRKMDAGNILGQRCVSIESSTNFATLEEKLLDVGKVLLLHVISEIEKLGKIEGVAQDENNVSFAPKIQAGDLVIDWKRPAISIHNQIRAFSPKPGAFAKVLYRGQELRLRVLEAKVVQMSGSPGDVLQWDKQGIVLACGQGALSIDVLQLAGKKVMEVSAFICGVNQDDCFFS